MSETDAILSNQRMGGTPDGPQPDFDDELADEIATALRSSSKSFVKASDVSRLLELESERSTNVAIGHRLSALAKREDAVVERWSPGNGSTVWRVLDS